MRVLPSLLLLLTACQSMPRDPFAAALDSSAGGDLLSALSWLDQIAPIHPSYAEARTLAAAVERRLRISSEMLVRGMTMRSEHRDDEAIRYFEQSLAVWSRNPLAHEMIVATRARTQSLRSSAPPDGAGSHGEVATTMPVEDAGGPSVELAAPVGPAPAPAVEPPPPAGTPADAAALLQSAQRMLDRGEADRALDLLEQLQAREPAHAEARALTIRLLRNRALVRYGQGQLEEAASDWARVVDLDPQDAQAQRFLRAARSELDERRRR